MSDETLDSLNRPLKLKNIVFQFVGTGVFLWLTMKAFSIFAETLIKDLLIITNLKPILIFGLVKIISFVILLTIFFIGLRKIKEALKSERKIISIFNYTIFAFIISQILQYLYPFVFSYLLPINYITNSERYYNYINSSMVIEFIPIGLEIVLYIFIGIIIKQMANKKEED